MSRTVDAAVAEDFFGMVPCRGPRCDAPYCHAEPTSPHMGGETPCYSTLIEDAWRIVPHLMRFQLTAIDGGGWTCRVAFDEPVTARTAPMAICLAALRNRGVEMEEL